MKGAVALFLGTALAASMVGSAFTAGNAAGTTTTPGKSGTVPSLGSGPIADASCVPAAAAQLTPEQSRMAKVGVDAAARAKVGDEGAVIIVATGLVESELKDLDGGDRDSVGWLQQRPSQGWKHGGDPAKAADDFFTEMKRLVPGWRGMDPGDVAQAVQRSGHPTRYGQRMAEARGIVAAVKGAKCEPGSSAPAVSGSCPATSSSAEKGLTPAALNVLRCGAQTWPKVAKFYGVGGRPNASDHPNGRAVDLMVPDWSTATGNRYGGQVAGWVTQNAAALHVKYVIWDGRIWHPSGAKAGWRTYTHPNGWTDPNSLHRNHVHVSVTG